MLGFITNHGYLDNPTFRGMRRNLMNTFHEIYLLDLHGNSKKKEIAPNGSKDENVFDIQQGVAIGIFIKKPADRGELKVYHADLWDSISKYQTLMQSSKEKTSWTFIQPSAPYYFFSSQNNDLRQEYEIGWKITDIFPMNSVGIVTARDALTIHWSHKEVWNTVNEFISITAEEARKKFRLGPDAQDWKATLAQEDLRRSGPDEGKIVSILYRPFDTRFTYYTGQSRGFMCRPRPEVMQHMIAGNNIGLLATRQTLDYWDIFTTKFICGHKTCAAYDINNFFPLYIYPKSPKKDRQISFLER